MSEEDFQLPDQDQAPASSADFRRLLFALLEKWWLIALCVLIGGALALWYLRRAPTIYAAIAVIKFDTDTAKMLKLQGALEEDLRNEELRKEQFKEIQQLIKSRALLNRVVEANNLAANPRFAPVVGTNAVSPTALGMRLAGSVTLNLRTGTRLIDVAVENADPQLAAQLANSVVTELIRLNVEAYRETSRAATSFLAEQAQELQRKLSECEGKLQTYKDQSLSLEQRQTVLADNLRQLNQKLNEVKADRIRLESEYAPIDGLAGNVRALMRVARIADQPNVASLQSSVAQQEVEFANLQKEYLPQHPTYIQAVSRLEETRVTLANAIARAAEAMHLSLANALASEAALTKELERQEQVAQDLGKRFVPYNTLLRDIEQYRTLYDSVVKRMGETTIAGNYDKPPIQLFQAADPPRNPIKPNKRFIMMAGVGAGWAIGVLLALGWGWLDSSLRTLDEAEQLLKVPVLSTIPKIRKLNHQSGYLIMDDDHPTAAVESFRALRTSVVLMGDDEKRRTFLVTSCLAGEGKTFCAVNFAASLAQKGLLTLLVDADLYRPMLEQVLLGEKCDTPGLTDLLSGQVIVPRETKIPNLFFIPAGTSVRNPSELLARQGLKYLLTQALPQFERIIVDAAPIFGVSDTLLLVKEVDAVCLVVRAGRTPRRIVLRSLQHLRRTGTPAGVVLNAVARSPRASYANPYYDYGYAAQKPAPKTT
jgi:capsular exopolysaccharide synthesis family protein